MPKGERFRLAVLIDADNSSVNVLADILAESSKLGTATIKRVYGDFTSTNLQSWGKVLAEHAVQPIQQYRNTTKKNASDSALIIDAMDSLHTKRFDRFLSRLQQFQFHPIGHAESKRRAAGLWIWRRKDTQLIRQSMQPVLLH